MSDRVRNPVPRSSLRVHRWRSRLFTFLAASSLLLCVATVGLWVWSYFRIDLIAHGTPLSPIVNEFALVSSQEGCLRIGTTRIRAQFMAQGWQFQQNPVSQRDWRRSVWFSFQDWRVPTEIERHFVFIPSWFVVVTLLALPTIRGFRHWRRAHEGCCPACGYDLRATPERCPECGLIPETERPSLKSRETY